MGRRELTALDAMVCYAYCVSTYLLSNSCLVYLALLCDVVLRRARETKGRDDTHCCLLDTSCLSHKGLHRGCAANQSGRMLEAVGAGSTVCTCTDPNATRHVHP